MRAFWWFKENAVAGMARPGFNSTKWLELPFDEGAVLGWIGTYSSGTAPMAAFRKHLQTYVPRIFQFHGLSPEQGAEEVRKFEDNAAFLAVAERLMKRTGFVQDIAIVEDSLRFSLGHAQLSEEIEFLKKQGIHRIAKANPSFSLTGAQSDLVEAVARNQVLAGSQAQ